MPPSAQDRRRTRERAAVNAAVSPNPFLALLATLHPDIESRLTRFLDDSVEDSRKLGREVLALVREIRRLSLRGGKRLRPALVVAGFRTANDKPDLDSPLAAGVALELLHTYFLIHDDWMDGDRVRRGGPAVHVALAARFHDEHKGNASAILAGDYALALACDALSRVEIAAERLREVYRTFAEMQLGAVAGQQLDMVGEGRNVELAYALKTGSYTVEGPLKLGALLGGAKPEVLSALSRYARPAGIAFQLRDDLLSLFGDPKRTGKGLAGDLKSGKRTLVLNLALARAKGAELAVLRKVVGNSRATDAQLQRALSVIESVEAPAIVERRIEQLSAEALAEVSSLRPSGRALLVGATEALSLRRS